jgi:hypothetical protein
MITPFPRFWIATFSGDIWRVWYRIEWGGDRGKASDLRDESPGGVGRYRGIDAMLASVPDSEDVERGTM